MEKNQPGCPTTSSSIFNSLGNLVNFDLSSIKDDFICDHMSAYRYYTDSIENVDCQYNAFPCTSSDDFNAAKCLKCGSNGCNKMGYYASPNADQGSLQFSTNDGNTAPFCSHSYIVNVESGNGPNMLQGRGHITMYFLRNGETTPVEVVDTTEATFKPESEAIRLISTHKLRPSDVTIDSVFIAYNRVTSVISSWLYDKEWSFKWVELTSGDEQTKIKYCTTKPGQTFASGVFVEFKPCK